jgi:hypothetical protein
VSKEQCISNLESNLREKNNEMIAAQEENVRKDQTISSFGTDVSRLRTQRNELRDDLQYRRRPRRW